jgi:hypothetical protein
MLVRAISKNVGVLETVSKFRIVKAKHSSRNDGALC